MSVRLFALTCGHLTGDLGDLMEGGAGRAGQISRSRLI